MCQAAWSSFLLTCSLALMPTLAVSWDIGMNDLEEKDVDEFHSNGFKCPTCIAVLERKCDIEFKWCRPNKFMCIDLSGIIHTGYRDMAIEMKKCIEADRCSEMITYMGFPVANQSKTCRSAIGNGAKVRPPPHIFFIFFLEKLLH